MNQVGFLEYALSTLFAKDLMKTKLLVSSRFSFPQLFKDDFGFVVAFPEPIIKTSIEGEETISLVGYDFPADGQGKRHLGSLFRAIVFHMGAHVRSSNFEDYEDWKKAKDPRLTKFVISLIEDVKANAYISSQNPDKLVDLAFANALALRRTRRIDRLVNPATRTMMGLLLRVNTGLIQVKSTNEHAIIARLAPFLDQFKEKAVQSSADDNANLKDEKLRIADEIYRAIEKVGPITKVPFLPHTEELEASYIPSRSFWVNLDVALEESLKECLRFLGGDNSPSEDTEHTWKKTAEAEAVQVFETWRRQTDREEKILAKYENLLATTRFKSVEFPEQDYSEFLRAKSRCKSEAHRLMESLLVVRNAVDEDPRKLYGVLDLQEVIQVVASKSPRLDVFMLDENVGKSYSWIVLLDASESMKCLRDFALELFLMLADAANELVLDSTSWALYAFNDRFLVIKDPKERYNVRVKSRIGGIDFSGLTYMPDALSVAGQVVKAKSEHLRLIIIISDGWPYGYQDINAALSGILNTLQKGNIVVVGVGAKSRRMGFFFKPNCAVYTLRDLNKKFSTLYAEASRVVAES